MVHSYATKLNIFSRKITNTTYPTRHHHPFHFEIPFARTDHYKFSYYPKSIRDWNNLPTDTIESQSLQVF